MQLSSIQEQLEMIEMEMSDKGIKNPQARMLVGKDRYAVIMSDDELETVIADKPLKAINAAFDALSFMSMGASV